MANQERTGGGATERMRCQHTSRPEGVQHWRAKKGSLSDLVLHLQPSSHEGLQGQVIATAQTLNIPFFYLQVLGFSDSKYLIVVTHSCIFVVIMLC